MRLDEFEVTAILKPILARDVNTEVRLFGSRCIDNTKRGDIDLLVLSDNLTLSNKIDILIEIKATIGEQKIDLILKKKNNCDAFTQSILANSIELNNLIS